MVSKILCLLGIHKYTSREVHITEPHINLDVNAVIISQCDRCGERKVTDWEKLTRWVVSEKYVVNKHQSRTVQ